MKKTIKDDRVSERKPPIEVALASTKAKTSGLAKRMEEAMATAAAKAQAEGISDPDEIRARMLEAREAAKNPKSEPEQRGSE